MKKFFLPFFLFLLSSLYSQELKLFYEYPPEGGVVLKGTLEAVVPVYAEITFPRLENLQPSVPTPYRVLFQPGDSERELIFLEVIDPQESYRFSYRYQYILGDPSVYVEENHSPYFFPWANGEKRYLSQGYFGAFSHRDAYALDFNMDIGSPIFAAKGGIVTRVKEDSRRGGPSSSYSDQGNLIEIFHPQEGIFTSYVHLDYQGSLVEVGQVVQTGDPIGFSGNTGFSTGPHLHFEAYRPLEDFTYQTLPVQFYHYDFQLVEPKEGQYYYARHPQGESFPVTFGRDLTDEDFADFFEPVEETGEFDFSTDQNDEVYVLFAVNGTSKTQNLDLELQLVSMDSTQGIAIQKEIPPLSKIFLTILKPKPGSRRASYSLRYRLSD